MSVPLAALLKMTRSVRRHLRRVYAYASLCADLNTRVPSSAVIEGSVEVHGTRNVSIGRNVLFYPGVYLETQDKAAIFIGDNVVLSRGVHIVARSGITIGEGTMIGEYTSIRDANHLRTEEISIRDAGHSAQPISIGREVWIGRGVTVLGGVIIEDKATVGANAVVTRNVRAGTTVVGVPAASLKPKAVHQQDNA